MRAGYVYNGYCGDAEGGLSSNGADAISVCSCDISKTEIAAKVMALAKRISRENLRTRWPGLDIMVRVFMLPILARSSKPDHLPVCRATVAHTCT